MKNKADLHWEIMYCIFLGARVMRSVCFRFYSTVSYHTIIYHFCFFLGGRRKVPFVRLGRYKPQL